jgi:hypothetical protein
MNHSVGIEALETRRLFNYDLTVTGLSELAPFTRPGGEIHFTVNSTNVGEMHFSGTAELRFTTTGARGSRTFCHSLSARRCPLSPCGLTPRHLFVVAENARATACALTPSRLEG